MNKDKNNAADPGNNMSDADLEAALSGTPGIDPVTGQPLAETGAQNEDQIDVSGNMPQPPPDKGGERPMADLVAEKLAQRTVPQGGALGVSGASNLTFDPTSVSTEPPIGEQYRPGAGRSMDFGAIIPNQMPEFAPKVRTERLLPDTESMGRMNLAPMQKPRSEMELLPDTESMNAEPLPATVQQAKQVATPLTIDYQPTKIPSAELTTSLGASPDSRYEGGIDYVKPSTMQERTGPFLPPGQQMQSVEYEAPKLDFLPKSGSPYKDERAAVAALKSRAKKGVDVAGYAPTKVKGGFVLRHNQPEAASQPVMQSEAQPVAEQAIQSPVAIAPAVNGIQEQLVNPKEVTENPVTIAENQEPEKVTFSQEKQKAYKKEIEPMLDIKGNSTGWERIDYADGAYLIHPQENYALNFKSKNTKSGTEALRAKALAQVYAIDNPISKPITSLEPTAPLEITPLYGLAENIHEDETPIQKALRISPTKEKYAGYLRKRFSKSDFDKQVPEFEQAWNNAHPEDLAASNAQEPKTAPQAGLSRADATQGISPTPIKSGKVKQTKISAEKDNILAAIAKMGGISRKEAEAQGIDPADFGVRGSGIRRVFTNNGMIFDQMAETLSQYAYPVTDEQGNYSPNTLLNHVNNSLAGDHVYTPRGLETQAKQMYADHVENYESQLENVALDIGADMIEENNLDDADVADLEEMIKELSAKLDEDTSESIVDQTVRSSENLSQRQFLEKLSQNLEDATNVRKGNQGANDQSASEGSRSQGSTKDQGGESQAVAKEELATDLFGAVPVREQAMYDHQQGVNERLPGMSAGAGDLFSGKSKQMDIDDAATPDVASEALAKKEPPKDPTDQISDAVTKMADAVTKLADKVDEIAKPKEVKAEPESLPNDAAKEKIIEEVERVQPSSTVAYFSDVSKRLRDGDVTLDEYKSAFELLSSSKEVISGELAKKTKAELLGMMDKMSAYRAKNEKKEDVIDSAYHDMLEDYVLGNSFSFSMGKNAYENGIRNVVNKQTDESLKEFADSIKLRREESRQKKEAAAVGMENPQALGDYVNLLKSYMRDGMSFQDARMKLTPVQRAEFDVLAGSETRNERKAKADQQKTEVRVAAQTTGAQIVEGVHAKHGYELWSVQLADKVDGDSYKTLLSTAKRMGGNYVNTMQARMWKTVWGFQFRDEDKAKAFMQLAAGDTTAAQEAVQERRDAFADDRSQSAVERLNEMAGKLDDNADSVLNADRKTNTSRRARFAASAESSANSSKAMAQTMRNIASAIESGKANFLDRVRQKTQVEMLHGIVNTAHYDELRNKHPQYSDYEKHIGEAPTTETADYVKFPDYTLYRSDMARLGRELLEAEGTKRLGQAIMKVADDTSDAYSKFAKENLNKVNQFRKQDGKLAAFSTKRDAENSIRGSGLSGKAIVLTVKRNEHLIVLSPSEAINQRLWDGDSDKRITLNKEAGAEIVEKIGKAARRGSKISMPWQFENAYEKLKRLSGMGIEKPAELRAAVREFINLKETPAKESKIKKMERSMIGRAKDGLDFFPTPESAADQMIEAADIKEGMSVLEPSAGMGHIADRIRDAGVEPDVIEMSGDRREILVAKGFNVVGSDFMASENGQYDRIIMNPPFSNRRDVEHVRHAYDLLNPGGRLVAIMGEGSFFGRDKKAVEFRDWLESIGGTSEKLDEGTFLDPSLPVNTGVNARMVVIEKPSTDDIKYSRRSTIGGAQGENEISQADLDRAINDFIQEFANPEGVEFVARESIVDAFGAENAARLRKQRVHTVKGAFYSKAGRVLLIRKGLADYRDALSTIRHELLGHYGLNLFTPTEKKAILEKIIESKEAVGISKTWKQIKKDYSDKSELEQAEEVFAKLAESKQFMLSKAWNSIIHFVKKLFVKMGFIPDTYTKKELYDLIETIGEGIRRGDSTQTNPEADDLQFSKKNLPDSIKTNLPDSDAVISSIQDVMESNEDEYEYFGLRVLPLEHTNKYRISDVLESSQVWVDGNPTGEELNGVSAISLVDGRKTDIEKALRNVGAGQFDHLGITNGGYHGSKVIVVGSRSIEYGEDLGEIIMEDGVVLAIYDKETTSFGAKGNIKAKINDQSQRDEGAGKLGINDPDIRFSRSATQNQTYTSKNGKRVTRAQIEALASKNNVTADEVIQRLGLVSNNATGGNSGKNTMSASPKNTGEIEATLFDELRFKAQDKFHYLNKAQNKVASDRGVVELPEAENAYLAELRYHGMAGAAIEDFQREHVDPLLEVISSAKVDVGDVDLYLQARHAKEANAQLERINPDREDNAALSGMSNDEAGDILTRMDSPIMRDIGKRVGEMTKLRREVLVASGLETQDTIDAWESAYRYYVPLKREGHDGKLPPRGKGFNTRGKEKRRAGSNSEVVHVLANVVAQYEATAIKAEKVKVGKAFLEFATNNPNKNLYEIDKVEYKPTFNAEGLVHYKEDKGFIMADNILVVRVDGVDHRVTFNEKSPVAMRIAHALNNLGATESGPIINVLSKLTRWLAIVNTGMNPEFVISNFARDLQTAGYNLSATEADGLKWKIIKDVGKAWKGIRAFQKQSGKHQEWAGYFDEFRNAGAQTGWLQSYSNIEDREKALVQKVRDLNNDTLGIKIKNVMGSVISFIENENTAVENAIRLSAFSHAIKSGISEAKAARLAKEMTVNFNRKGDMGPVLNAMYLFYNASIQGSVRLLQAVGTSRKVQAMAGATIIFAAVLDIVNRAIGGDDDDGEAKYDKIPAFVKERNLIIMSPSGKGDYIKIPLPWGYNVLHVIGQVVGESATRRGFNAAESAMRVAISTLSAFNPIGGSESILQFLSPTITDPLVQWAENKDWAGKPLRPESNPFGVDTPNSQKYWNSVRAPSKWITDQLNSLTGGDEVRPGSIDISPEAIDLLIDTFTGGAGRFLSDVVATPIKAISNDPVESYEIPLLRKVYGAPGIGTVVSDFYERMDQVMMVDKQLKHYRSDREKIADIRSSQSGEVRLLPDMTLAQSQLRKLRKRIKAYEKSGNKAGVTAGREREKEIMQRFNKSYNIKMERFRDGI